MIRKVLLIWVLLLPACSSLQNPSKDVGESLPVYVDKNSYFQIYYPDERSSFPFDTGDKVEIEGTLIYHGINDWVRTEMLSAAKWHASLYPHGSMLTPEDESLIVLLKDAGGQKEPSEIEWPVDHDTRFIIISDKPFPKGWSEILDIGTSTQVCFYLAVEVTRNADNGDDRLITFRPIGEIADSLMLTEVHSCP